MSGSVAVMSMAPMCAESGPSLPHGGPVLRSRHERSTERTAMSAEHTDDLAAADMEMTTKEAAAYLSGPVGFMLDARIMYGLRSVRRGPVAEKQGSRLVYRKSALDAFLREHGTDVTAWTEGMWREVAGDLRAISAARPDLQFGRNPGRHGQDGLGSGPGEIAGRVSGGGPPVPAPVHRLRCARPSCGTPPQCSTRRRPNRPARRRVYLASFHV
jgi:hypothetical protein